MRSAAYRALRVQRAAFYEKTLLTRLFLLEKLHPSFKALQSESASYLVVGVRQLLLSGEEPVDIGFRHGIVWTRFWPILGFNED